MPFFFRRPCLRSLVIRGFAGMLFGVLVVMDTDARERYAAQRRAMLDDVARTTLETRRETGRSALDKRVMEALGRVPRHKLVPAGDEAAAYLNRPLPIGQGQTISQPFIVGLMTDLLEVQPGHKVLEIGTGSGYQAAVLAELGAKVYSIEIVRPLGEEAAARLKALRYTAVATRIGDGYRGWPEEAPFDSIIVTAAAREVPPALAEQLKTSGRMVIPLGESGGAQTLYVMEKDADGKLARHEVLAVRFVPFTGEAEKPR